MISSMNSSLSALRAFGTKTAVIANNVANIESDGFKKSRALLNEGIRDEVRVEIEQVDTPGPVVPETRNGERIERELSNVDLAEEIPETIPTQRGFEANIKMIKTEDKMLGSVIDQIS